MGSYIQLALLYLPYCALRRQRESATEIPKPSSFVSPCTITSSMKPLHPQQENYPSPPPQTCTAFQKSWENSACICHVYSCCTTTNGGRCRLSLCLCLHELLDQLHSKVYTTRIILGVPASQWAICSLTTDLTRLNDQKLIRLSIVSFNCSSTGSWFSLHSPIRLNTISTISRCMPKE